MKVIIVVSPSHRQLYHDWFLPSLPGDAEVEARTLEGAESGDYLSSSWQAGVTAKLYWALEFAEANPGAVFWLVDIDVQCFPAFTFSRLTGELEESGADVLFQRESIDGHGREANTGCYVARCTPYVIALLREAIGRCESSEVRNDQTAMNAVLKPEDFGKSWGLLSAAFYARSHGFPPGRDIVFHHANFTRNVGEKVRQLRRVRRYVLGGMPGRWLSVMEELADYAVSGKLAGMIGRKIRKSRP